VVTDVKRINTDKTVIACREVAGQLLGAQERSLRACSLQVLLLLGGQRSSEDRRCNLPRLRKTTAPSGRAQRCVLLSRTHRQGF
jgi:hypothetical protein